jgi:diacylglycerol O-acyltransferase
VRRLSGVDAAFVYMETATNHLHVALVAVFDPATMPDGYTFGCIRDLVESRLPLVPPFRWRLREVPFRLQHPAWVEDADFDLDQHVHRVSLPAPGGDAELASLAAEVFSQPLDRRRPLWEMYVVEGLQGGMFAVITKVHHAAIDGVSGAEILGRLLDISVDAASPRGPDAPWQPEPSPSDLSLIVGAGRDFLGRLGSMAGAARRALETISQPNPEAAGGLRVPHAPRTGFNVSITPERRFATVDVSLDDVKAIKNAAQGTVNDVALALCAGALRGYLAFRGTLPASPLVALVPVSVRTAEESSTLGNRVSGMLISLPTHVADPRERLAQIVEATRAAKDHEEVIDVATLTQWADLLAPGLAAKAARALMSAAVVERFGPRFNVVVSNVRGPDFPMYLAGAKLVRLWPMGPVADGVALNMTVMSYLGCLRFGLVACRDTVPDLAELAESIQAEVAVLLATVATGGGQGIGTANVTGTADVAQLVEHHLAKVRVAGSNPVVRSR